MSQTVAEFSSWLNSTAQPEMDNKIEFVYRERH